MNAISYELDSGFLVSLRALRLGLERMSHSRHQWAVVTVPGILRLRDGESRSNVLVGYTNPDPSGLPNYLSFILPLVALGGGSGPDRELIVSLSPRTMTPVSKGLYFEDGNLKYDLMEDWARVWHPLKQELWPDECMLKQSTKHKKVFDVATPELRDRDSMTADNPYRAELVSFITALSESEEVIRDAVQD
jgi:hypothetical protein